MFEAARLHANTGVWNNRACPDAASIGRRLYRCDHGRPDVREGAHAHQRRRGGVDGMVSRCRRRV
jgi:hypothetical protein